MQRFLGVLLVIGVLAMSGCGYVQNRISDAGDTMDLGVTVSSKPQFAAYGCALGLAGAGYGKLDGHVAGLFGGRVGVQSLDAEIWGAGPVGGETLQVGQEEATKRCTGAVCIARKAPEGTTKSTSCCHYLHLGFMGLAGNIHYKELLDFFGGFVGFDVSGDDGGVMTAVVTADQAESDARQVAAEEGGAPQRVGEKLTR